MFGDFEQGSQDTDDCQADCYHKYLLKARYYIFRQYTIY